MSENLKYRKFGKLDWEVSVLGFGAMRLPIIGKDRSKINEDLAIKMIRYAIDHGVNYIDTAYPYHSGSSEVLVGKVLQDGYREKVKVATKMPTWQIESQDDMETALAEQLKRLQTNIDFYLLHGLTGERWTKLLDLNVLDWCEKQINEGKIGYLGFSFHDKYAAFKKIIDEYTNWVSCQFQYNYMDTEYQAGTKGLKYAASKGLAVVVMEPIVGGMLAVASSDIQEIWDSAKVKRTPAEWALQWVWNHPEVSLALSGMSTLQHVVENVASASRSRSNSLTEKELALITKVRNKYRKIGFIGCTNCKYCIPCPEDVDIPVILDFLNQFSKSRGDPEARKKIREQYKKLITPEIGAKRCAKCGECEDKCPQSLPVKELIDRAGRFFERDT